MTASELLGHVSCTSGRLPVVDPGILARLRSDQLGDFSVQIDGVPTGGRYELRGRRVGEGRWAACWREVWLQIDATAPPSESVLAGTVPVDYARLMLVDQTALASWDEGRSLDGKAD